MLERIKAAQLEARKARLAERASILTTIIGEAEMVGKNAGNRATTNEEVVTVLRKFEKNLRETIDALRVSGRSENTFTQYLHELEIVLEFLPAKLTDLQVQKDIGTLMSNLGLAKEQKSMGVIVKELKAKYGAQFDGQQVSTVFKEMLR